MYYGGCNNEDCPMSRVVTGEYSTRAEVIIALNSRPASDLQQRLDKAEKALEKAYKDLDDSGAWDMYKDVCDVMGDINKALAAITPAQAKDKEIEE
jgi:tetratricopeptide (TPR) repeat protein